jgi:hypothetical protein
MTLVGGIRRGPHSNAHGWVTGLESVELETKGVGLCANRTPGKREEMGILHTAAECEGRDEKHDRCERGGGHGVLTPAMSEADAGATGERTPVAEPSEQVIS